MDTFLPPLTQHLRNRMPDDRPRLLNLSSREACSQTHLQRRWGWASYLFRDHIIGDALQTGDEDAIGERLFTLLAKGK